MYSDEKVIFDFSIVFIFCLLFCRKLFFFSDKIGCRREIDNLYPWFCKFGRCLEGDSGGIGTALYLLHIDYGRFCRCSSGRKSIV